MTDLHPYRRKTIVATTEPAHHGIDRTRFASNLIKELAPHQPTLETLILYSNRRRACGKKFGADQNNTEKT